MKTTAARLRGLLAGSLAFVFALVPAEANQEQEIDEQIAEGWTTTIRTEGMPRQPRPNQQPRINQQPRGDQQPRANQQPGFNQQPRVDEQPSGNRESRVNERPAGNESPASGHEYEPSGWRGGSDPSRADLGRRQSDVGDKRFYYREKNLEVNEEIMDRRFQMKEWHGKFNSLGRQIAPIDVEETREKRIVEPEVMSVERVDWGMARQNQERAYVRNFDTVHETRMVSRYENADVAAVRREHPDLRVEGEDFRMRDLNRFSFQRNHSPEEGVRRGRAGAGDNPDRQEMPLNRRE